jgi:SpoVK/Ycf46/Vps4 family AAA+-type ATPase
MASQKLRALPFFNSLSIVLTALVAVLALGSSVRAQNSQVEADATKAAQLESYRAFLMQKDQADPSAAAGNKAKEYAADSEAMDLVNKNYDGPSGAKSTLFHQVEVKVSSAIMADPAAHQAELSQIDAQMAQDAKAYTQKPAQTGQTRSPATSTTRTTTPPQTTQEASSSASFLMTAFIAVVVLLALGAVGYFFYMKQRQKPSSPSYSGAKSPQFSAPAIPPAQAASSSRPTTVVAVPQGAGAKAQLFAEQRAKYQTRYNDLADEITDLSAQLTQFAAIPQGIESNLKLLSKAIHDRLKSLVEAQTAGTAKILAGALILMPAWRVFKRAGLLLKLIVAGAIFVVARTVYFLFVNSPATGLPAMYAALVMLFVPILVVSFFFERRYRLKAPLDALRSSVDALKPMMVAHIFDNQAPQYIDGAPSYRAIRVNSPPSPLVEEYAAKTAGNENFVPGAFLLFAGRLAAYRLAANGAITPFLAIPGDFMNRYGAMLNQAVTEQSGFASSTIPPLAEYAKLIGRKRQAADQLPRLEALVRSVDRVESLWRDVYVEDKLFEFLMRRIDLFNMGDTATPSGILLYGYPGNGKAYLARKIAESVSARLETVEATTLASPDAIKSLWDRNRGKNPVVLFVDHAEQVFPKPGSENQGSGTREGTLAWLSEWGKASPGQSRVWVVLAASSEKELHPSIASQIGGSKFEVPAPNQQGREIILRNASRENSLPAELPVWLAASTSGCSIRELCDLVKEAKLLSLPNAPSDDQWRQAIKTVRGADAQFRDESKTWDRLVLPEDVKSQLQRACKILREADRYKAQKVRVPNILLYGPPGTGKTDIARTFANEGGVQFVSATTADMKAQYIGQSAPLVRKKFAEARAKSPCVLFIDEIETVAGKRDSGGTDVFTQDIVTEMLAQMDGVAKDDRPIFVLAATNIPEKIDPAILSRFTSQIQIPLPDEPARREILKRLLAERIVDPAMNVDEVTATMAQNLKGKSGRDLVKLVDRAMERAVLEADAPEGVVLSAKLLLGESSPKGRSVSEEQLQKIWSQIILKPEIKETILAKIRMFNAGDQAAPRGLLLYGPPGTGKTEIARCIKDSTGSELMSLTAADLKAGYIGQSGQSVQKIWEKARQRGRCIMFIDECDAVFGRRGSLGTDSGVEEIVPQFLAEWDGVGSDGTVWVIGATNQRERIDPAIMSRFGSGSAIEITLPEAPQRLEILRLEMQKLKRPADIPDFVAGATTGFAGRDLSQIAKDICSLSSERNAAISPEMWKEVIARYTKAGSESVDEDASWESLVLSDETIEKLQTICQSLKFMDVLMKQGIKPPRGALLYGPPGTGKTRIAKTMANESGLPFLAAGPSDIKAGYIGQSGIKVHELFERARAKAPCILFIDEIDSGVPARGSGKSDQFTDEIVTQMLTELDGVKKNDRPVFLLAATNRRELVDEAILSRFIDQIEIPRPTVEQRRRLFEILLAKKHLDFDPARLSEEIASRAGDISGRDIYSIIERAAQSALRRALKAGRPDQVILSREDVIAQLPSQAKSASGGASAPLGGRIPAE